MIAATPGLVRLDVDPQSVRWITLGFRAADTPRLSSLLTRMAERSEIVMRRRVREGLPLGSLAAAWQRRRGAWTVRHMWESDARETSDAELARIAPTRRGLGASAVDFVPVLAGPDEWLLGNVIRIRSIDLDRGTFSPIRVALVAADGSIGPLERAVVGYVPPEARS